MGFPKASHTISLDPGLWDKNELLSGLQSGRGEIDWQRSVDTHFCLFSSPGFSSPGGDAEEPAHYFHLVS